MSTATLDSRQTAGNAIELEGRAWWTRLLATADDRSATILRVVLGAVMLPHGLQKLVGAFGGYGFEATMGFFTQSLGLPWVVGFLVIVAESFGSLGLIAGFLTRISAFGLGAVMVGAVLTGHLAHGFFMNWSGTQAGEGFEYHLLVLGMAAALLVRGGGAFSIDGWLSGRGRA